MRTLIAGLSLSVALVLGALALSKVEEAPARPAPRPSVHAEALVLPTIVSAQ